MSAQLQINVVTWPSLVTTSCQQRANSRAAMERFAIRPSPAEDLLAVEVHRLLQDVRAALTYDLGTATQVAGRLAAILATKLQQNSRPGAVHVGLALWQKRKVEIYIEDHLEGPIRVRDLAGIVSLGSGQFSRSFKQSFGAPPHAYIVRIRIKRAQTLMMTTRDSLSHIALACGLWDQAHFCRRFRQITGTTPGAWRRSHATGP